MKIHAQSSAFKGKARQQYAKTGSFICEGGNRAKDSSVALLVAIISSGELLNTFEKAGMEVEDGVLLT